MGECKGTFHAQWCHWIATVVAFTTEAAAWPTAHASANYRRRLLVTLRMECRNRVQLNGCFVSGISCPRLDIPHSRRAPHKQVYYVGDRVTYTCSRGFRESGWTALTCDNFGRWKRNGQELTQKNTPTCIRKFVSEDYFFTYYNATCN